MYKTWLAVIILVTLFIAAIPIHTGRVSAQAGTGTQTPTLQPIFAVQTVTPESDGSVVHKVLPGQTLFGIAEAYQVSVTTIAALNNLATPYTIFPGDLLIISPKPTPTVTLEATETQQATRVTYGNPASSNRHTHSHPCPGCHAHPDCHPLAARPDNHPGLQKPGYDHHRHLCFGARDCWLYLIPKAVSPQAPGAYRICKPQPSCRAFSAVLH